MADATRRVFVALWPDPAVADALHALSARAAPCCGGRRMRHDTLHLTLEFIGDVAESRVPAVLAALAAVRADAFRLELDTLGHWPHNHLLWAGCRAWPAALDRLVVEIRRALAGLGMAPATGAAFFPHVTLIRKARPSGPLPEVGAPIALPVSAWVLVESCRTADGASYRRLGSGMLG